MAGVLSFSRFNYKSLITFLVLNVIVQQIQCIKDSKMVVDANPAEMQRISILVGRAGEENSGDSTGSPDNGNNDDSIGSGGEAPVTSANYDASCTNGQCCFQFTWPGYLPESEIPAPENATCKYLQTEKKDDSFACFDPIVYTEKTQTNTNDEAGNSPDIIELGKRATENDWNIYCPRTKDKTCLTFKYYSRGGKNQVVNETRFCGSITETNTGNRITSGCYKEEVRGYIKEVCACQDRNLCNSSTKIFLNSFLATLSLVFLSVSLTFF